MKKKRGDIEAFRGIEQHLDQADYEALDESFTTAATKAKVSLQETALEPYMQP